MSLQGSSCRLHKGTKQAAPGLTHSRSEAVVINHAVYMTMVYMCTVYRGPVHGWSSSDRLPVESTTVVD